MKNSLKREIKNLLNGGKEKQDILIVDTYNCDPGFYRHDDKTISEAELNELKKDFNHTVIFVSAEGKTLNGGGNVLNVTTAENAEKLKDFLTE